MPHLSDVKLGELIEVAPEDTLGEVAERMSSANVGAVLVKDFGRLIGILTERDMLKAMAARVHTSEARVRQWMTDDPITASTDTGSRRGRPHHARARLPPSARARRERPGDRDRKPAARRRGDAGRRRARLTPLSRPKPSRA